MHIDSLCSSPCLLKLQTLMSRLLHILPGTLFLLWLHILKHPIPLVRPLQLLLMTLIPFFKSGLVLWKFNFLMLTICFFGYRKWSYIDIYCPQISQEMSETVQLLLSSKSNVAICVQYYVVSLFHVTLLSLYYRILQYMKGYKVQSLMSDIHYECIYI